MNPIPDVEEKIEENQVQKISVPTWVRIVSSHTGVEEADLRGKSRIARIVAARHLLMFVLRFGAQQTLKQIAEELDLDHTSVMHGIRETKKRLKESSGQDLLDAIRRQATQVAASYVS